MPDEPKPPTDHLAIRSSIRDQVLQKTPAFKGYQILCKTIGDDVIDFGEYSFWYYRFYHGNLDINHDRSADPKPLTFNDLPNEMLQKIVSNLDWKNRLTSRKVCRKLLGISRQMPKKFEKIAVEVDEDRISMQLNKVKIDYYSDECTITTGKRYREVTVEGDYVLRATNDLKAVLDGSRIEIQYFEIVIGSRITRKLPGCEEILQSLWKISDELNGFDVEEAVITNRCADCEIDELIALFKPRVLKKFQLGQHLLGNKDTDIDELHEMDQFKYAEEINIAHLGTIDASLIFEHFQHFEWFRVSVPSMSAEQIVSLRDMLTSSAHSRGCIISIDVSLTRQWSSIRRALGAPKEASSSIYPRMRYQFEVRNAHGEFFDVLIRLQRIVVVRHPQTPQERKCKEPGRRLFFERLNGTGDRDDEDVDESNEDDGSNSTSGDDSEESSVNNGNASSDSDSD